MDILTPEKRSALMARIGSKDTKPELKVRRLLHVLGYRFRLHRKGLPGRPDIVLPKWKTAIFVHGCFWHRHPGCKDASTPKTNVEFWEKKFLENTTRDERVSNELRQLGWKVVVIWECETKSLDKLAMRLIQELTE
ncbi:very short patch repair endonuclease [uncultured Roseibium sp.]|uniref:very short patch repair endonuclease n=1 Tax=uncultured Roseibium sp. TaxID=1936171 RepID=UPI003217EB60